MQVLCRLLAFGLDSQSRQPGGKFGWKSTNNVLRERGYRKDVGAKGAVAVLFGKRFIKFKAATCNWANPRLTEAQLVYTANNAYSAMRVFDALGLTQS